MAATAMLSPLTTDLRGARLLDLDGTLAWRLSPEARDRLRPMLRVRLATVEPGARSGRSAAPLAGPRQRARRRRDRWVVADGPVRVAILDRGVGALVGRVPDLMAELLDRSLSRGRSPQFQLALTRVRGVGRRLELLLWHLAERWSRVTTDGWLLRREPDSALS